MLDLNDIVRIEKNQLIIDDSKLRPKQFIKIAIQRKFNNSRPPYRLAKTFSGKYLLN